MTKNVLAVLTSSSEIPKTGSATGWYLPELAHPYAKLREAGVLVTLASPRGGEAPLDTSSVEPWKDDKDSFDFLSTKAGLWANTIPLSVLDPVEAARDYDALFYPGGQGPMFDLPENEHSIALIREFAAARKPIAAVCHGPSALVNVKLPNGKHILDGRTVTSISNAEDESMGALDNLPFHLESELSKVATYVKADKPFAAKVVVDGNIITGQNPNSSMELGEALVKALGL